MALTKEQYVDAARLAGVSLDDAKKMPADQLAALLHLTPDEEVEALHVADAAAEAGKAVAAGAAAHQLAETITAEFDKVTAEGVQKFDDLLVAHGAPQMPDVTPMQTRAVAVAIVGYATGIGVPMSPLAQALTIGGATLLPAVLIGADAFIRWSRAKHIFGGK